MRYGGRGLLNGHHVRENIYVCISRTSSSISLHESIDEAHTSKKDDEVLLLPVFDRSWAQTYGTLHVLYSHF